MVFTIRKKGGMFRTFSHSGKNAYINFPTVIPAMTLYKITGEAAYLQKAKRYTTGR
ncbi:hypothetical protein [Chitinophaga sp.]|uniref:hypothetical protein n=1 Tax=Chitinophaga sp. TaxID=1869181 RepID=UPI002F91CCEE